MKKLDQRPSANKTREKILRAAEKFFAAKGFSATSTAAIAKAAKVNEALLFHHFGNKEQLWRQVKSAMVDHLNITAINLQPSTLKEFLIAAITQRVSAYQAQPNLAKFMEWQRLEENNKSLMSGNKLAPNNWLPAIEYLQRQKKINAKLSAEMIITWLTYSINAIIQDGQKSSYVNFLVENFEKALKS